MKKLLYYVRLTGILTISVLALQSCQNVKNEREISKLLQTDRAFSDITGEKGVKRALVDYVDTTELVLKKDMKPLDGKDAAIKYFISQSDSGIVLTWKPLGADIVNSGKIGFTYGTYKIESIDSVSKGTYVTVWRKSANGRWISSLYAGNDEFGKKNQLD